MKRCLLMMLAMLLCTQKVYAAEPAYTAKAAVIYDADYGRVLYEYNSNAPMLIASTTKIMTAVVALEQCSTESLVTVTDEMTTVEGSSMYLQTGKEYTLKELLYGLMLASGNDAANAIAMHVAGDTEAFAALMNQKAAALGLENTRFANPHGLDQEGHYSTALDMARLMAYAMENSTFAEIVRTRSMTVQGITYVNHNKLLWQCDGVIGGKTGYTKAAGRTLVTCCEREGQRLICVTLSDPDDWNDHSRLYDWAYGEYERQLLVSAKTRYVLPMLRGNGTTVAVEPLGDAAAFVNDPQTASVVVELPRFVFGPVYMGDRAGRILIQVNGITVEELPLVYMENRD